MTTPFTPLPISPTPYISPLTLINAPTGIDWTTIPPGDDVTPGQNQAEWTNMCARATARADEYCNQVLRATTDNQLLHGPDYPFVTVGPGGGGSTPGPYWGTCGFNARIILERWPVLQVTAVQVCPNNLWPRTWTSVTSGFFEPEKPPIGIYGSIAPSNAVSGGQAIIVAPGWVDWRYGRNGWAIQVSYINGWPHAGITSKAAKGDMTLHVDDCTGWGTTSYYSVTGATGTIKDTGQQEVIHATAASATAGPGTLTLSQALQFDHQVGTVVTTLPSTVEQACIFFAAAEALTRGATSTTIHDIGGHAQSAASGAELISEGELLLKPYRRTI